MGFAGLTATLIGRFVVACAVVVCVAVALVVAGAQALMEVDNDPPEYPAYGTDDDGAWTPL